MLGEICSELRYIGCAAKLGSTLQPNISFRDVCQSNILGQVIFGYWPDARQVLESLSSFFAHSVLEDLESLRVNFFCALKKAMSFALVVENCQHRLNRPHA